MNAALKHSRDKYRVFFEKSVDAMLIIEDYKFVDCNKAALKMLHYGKKEEMINTHPAELSPEYQPDGKKSIEKAKEMMDIAYQKGAILFEWIHKRKNGELFPVEVSLTAISTDETKILHTVWRDISARKKAEMERNKLKEELLHSQKMEAIGLMAGGVAHDLNNILSGIVTYPEVLLYNMPSDNPMYKPLTIIKESGERAAAIVADLLTVARGIAAPRKVCDLNKLIINHLNSPEHLHLRKINPGVSLETNLSSELLLISCSEVHIRKIIMNLIVNAYEAVNANGNIIVSTHKKYIKNPPNELQKGDYNVLSVIDNGQGIPKEDLKRIFEPFYTKKFLGRSGTGLGLSIVWNSVKDHNGFININTGHSGTTFDLYFPAFNILVDNNNNEIQKNNYSGHGEKILIVENETIQQDLLKNILSMLNYSSNAVSTGEEAVEFLKKNPADIVILDMILGKGMNGKETYEKIIEFSPGQKAIIISGYSKNEDVVNAQKLGAGKFISKPYDINTIGKTIFEALHG